MKKTTTITISIIILITAIIAGSFWYVNSSQKSKAENQKLVEQQVANEKEQKNQNPTDEVIEKLVINKKWTEDAPQLKKEFNSFIKEHGEKIELEKIDTTNWKTYKDEKRGFEFKYPQDWYVIPIDSTWSLTDSYSKKGQKRESKIIRTLDCEEPFTDSSIIKGCTQPYPFLCIADKYTYESIPQRFKDKNSIYEYNHEYCDIVLEETFPRLKSSDKSAGRMWFETYQISKNNNANLKYLEINGVYMPTSDFPTFLFNFLNNRGGYIKVIDQHHQTPIILQTIKYTN